MSSGVLLHSSAPTINHHEFPQLGVRGAPSPVSAAAPTTSFSRESPINRDVIGLLNRAPYANLMRDASLNNPEFHIQNEDFPALPGANHLGGGQSSSLPMGGSVELCPPLGGERFGIDASRGDQQQQAQQQPRHGIHTSPEGEVTGIPAGMLNDQFGMAGLVTYLRSVDNPAIVALALGHDLTTLGLNLSMSERALHTTFGGPWADYPCRTQDIDAKVPEEYLTNVTIREKLPSIKLNKLSEDVLFYLFYNCPGEVYQMAAACELYVRDWRFHKVECVWLTRSQYGGCKEQTPSYERGSYNVFDPLQWRKIPKDMKLEYKDLEAQPKLPSALQQQMPSAGTPLGMGAPAV